MPLQYRLNLKWGKIELAAPENELVAFKHWVNQVTNLAHQKSGGEKRGGVAGQRAVLGVRDVRNPAPVAGAVLSPPPPREGTRGKGGALAAGRSRRGAPAPPPLRERGR